MCVGVYRAGEAQFTGIADVLTNLLTMGVKVSLGRHFGSSGGHPTSSRRRGTGCMVMGGDSHWVDTCVCVWETHTCLLGGCLEVCACV